MTQAQHTPGPWATYVNKANDVVIRKMLSDCMECCEIARVKTGFSDSRLIAAAPELLEALQEAIDCGMVPVSTAKEGGACAHSRQVLCADMIRAAIAKATGA